MKGSRFRWFAHFKRRDGDTVCKTMLKLKPLGKRPQGRPKSRVAGVSEEEAIDSMWRFLKGAAKRQIRVYTFL